MLLRSGKRTAPVAGCTRPEGFENPARPDEKEFAMSVTQLHPDVIELDDSVNAVYAAALRTNPEAAHRMVARLRAALPAAVQAVAA